MDYVIIELIKPDQQQWTNWTACSLFRLPLMRDEALKPLQQEGPWLVCVEDGIESTLTELEAKLGSRAIKGWISSYSSADELCQHLAKSLVAQRPNGQTALLRSYSPAVLPVLHERNDCSWHSSLFGPINAWWFKDNKGVVKVIQGGASYVMPDYQPIVLDEALMQKLAVDPQAVALLDDMEASTSHVFTSDCHSERLQQVSHALAQGRESGLEHPEDQLLFATLSLLNKQPLDEMPEWQQIKDTVLEQGVALSKALETRYDEGVI